jgi:hypothetical protein
MTAAKGKIKVIKKGTQIAPSPAVVTVEDKKSTKEAAREMVSTVSNWVTEFQQRRRVETRQAIEQFFSQQPQTSSV